MLISRFIFFSANRRLARAPNLLQRFGPSKRIQSCGYVKSAKNNYKKPTSHPVMNVETQSSRSWSAYVIPAALLGFGGLVAFLHYNDERRAIKKGQGNNRGYGAVAAPIIGGPFTLVNTENQIVNEQDFLGNWVLLYFGYTSSPDIGPDQAQMMAEAIDTLESKENLKVLPVFVTIDPQRDTPAQLRAYLKEFDPRIVGLTGPVSAVRQMAQEYRVFFRKVEEEGDDYLVESSHNMYLLDPKMKVVRFFGLEYNAEELSKEILKELKKHQPKAE
ncbi:protein SCO1 homolog 2, mitochondrial [Durio zibethinus]|uniref:Protein SCO1 homolog 2, mitochondrial n=1 Tax=Durio zibethinus TaxID=66656 RepID=A0A6P5YJN2_DURZI|nr:protein SCO1 homolog 2, mitochondrial [Durio zibethinus]